jgi:aconitate decarboxylase
MPGLTQSLAAYVAAPTFGDTLAAACEIARRGMTDTIATSFAGAAEPVVQIMLAHCQANAAAAGDTAPLTFAHRLLPMAQAACVNGVAAHALDFDDVALSGHPSTVLTPAILAQAHVLSSSGTEALRAYVIGYEVWAELSSRESDPYHLKGWHPTAVLGTIAATAALAYLRRLPAPVVQHALGIAASLSSGLVANFGSMTKPLHAGRAAALAFEAIDLAQRGLTAAPDVLEHPAGFLHAISLNGHVDRDSPAAIGSISRIVEHGLAIKQYPVCYSGHRTIDGVLEIAARENIDPATVKRVDASIGRSQASMLRNHAPHTALEAKFSLEFAVASALVARKVGLAELDDGFVQRPDVRSLYEKVDIGIAEKPCPLDSAFAFADRVVITLNDGRSFDSGDIRFARGHARLPLSESGLRAKFEACMAAGPAGQGERPASGALYARLADLGSLKSLQTLFAA